MWKTRQRSSANTKKKHPGRVRYLVAEILRVCGDEGSSSYYGQVAGALPDEVIFQFLPEIRQDTPSGTRERSSPPR